LVNVTHHYSAAVELHPDEQTIRASVTILWREEGTASTLSFLLHRNLTVTEIEGELVEGYERLDGSDFPYTDQADTYTVGLKKPLSPGEETQLRFTYGANLATPFLSSSQVNRISPEFVEMGMYAPWFPWNPYGGPFTYHVETALSVGHEAEGTGTATKTDGNVYRLISDRPSQDIVLLAAPAWRRARRERGIATVEFLYTDPRDETDVGLIADDALWALEFFNSRFGELNDAERLKLAFLPRQAGGAYSRPGLIVFPQLEDEDRGQHFGPRFGTLAHEISHLWWREAPVDGWEDWLNEGFATYSQFLAQREIEGQEQFARTLAAVREKTQGLPPIWGLPRTHDNSYQVLYLKGALVLFELEEMLGLELFTQVLRERLRRGANSTEEFLRVLAEGAGIAAAEKCRAALKD
jgi:aminopeptidase N